MTKRSIVVVAIALGLPFGISSSLAQDAAASLAGPAPRAAASQPAITPLAHVEERGTGPITLILVPGLGCDWHVYDAFMTRNADKYRMFAVTLPGFGTSQPPPLPEGSSPTDQRWLDNAEAAILQLIKDRKIEKPVLVGHSLGGTLATRAAARHGDVFRATISIDGLPVFPPPMPGQPDTAEARRSMVNQVVTRAKGVPAEQWAEQQKKTVSFLIKDQTRAGQIGEMSAAVPRDVTVEYMGELMSCDLRPDLAKISIPSLTISAISMDGGRAAMQTIRGAVEGEFKGAPENVKVVFFEDTRHFVMEDRPAELDRAIAAFLAGEKVQGVTAGASVGDR